VVRRSRSAIALACGTLLFTLALAEPAGSLGEPSLDRRIVADPVAGWRPAPSSQVRTLVEYLSRVETAAVSSFGGSSAVAVQGWVDPSSPKSSLFVALISLSVKDMAASTLDKQVVQAAAVAAQTFCEGATANPPVSDRAVESIPASHHVRCGPAPNGATPTAVTFAKANVFGLVFANSLSPGRLDAVALAQHRALSPLGASVPSSSGRGVGVIVSIVALAAAIGLGLLIVFLRRRRGQHQPDAALGAATAWPFPAVAATDDLAPGAPPAGRYPDPSGSGATRYWTGTEWGPGDPPASSEPPREPHPR